LASSLPKFSNSRGLGHKTGKDVLEREDSDCWCLGRTKRAEGFRVLEKQAETTGNGILERKNSKCTTWCLGKKEQYLQKMVSWI
jgi:hypothetical protein